MVFHIGKKKKIMEPDSSLPPLQNSAAGAYP